MSERRDKSRAKWIVLGVIGSVVFLSILVALLQFVNFRSGNASAIRELEARIKQKGEPLTTAELMAAYPPIPDQVNGAVALLQVWERENPPYWRAFREGRSSLPPTKEPAVDRAVPFRGADAQQIARMQVLQVTNIAAAEAHLASNQEHLAAVRIALQHSQFRFPLATTNGLMRMLYSHVSELRKEAQNFRIEALIAGEHGDVDGAIANLEYVARTGHALAAEPLLISQLTRCGLYSMVLADLQRLLSHHSLSVGQLERVDALLDQLQMTGVLRSALVAERVAMVSVFSLPPSQLNEMLISNGADDSTQASYQVGFGVLGAAGLKDADHRLILETMEKAIALAERDDPEAMKENKMLFDRVAVEATKFPPKIFVGMLLPNLQKIPTRFASFEARRRSGKVAIAIERYRLAHNGALPDHLESLVPQYLPAIPNDPFDANPLRFRPLPAGFVVYSIGENRADDSGKERPLKGSAKDIDETFIIER